MATFEEQVEAATGISITSTSVPTQTDLNIFLFDGVKDVTTHSIVSDPLSVLSFARETELTIDPDFDLDGARIIGVFREAGDNTDLRECRFIPPSQQSRVTDSTSMAFASKFNPAYTVLNDGAIKVFPVPNASNNRFKVMYVNDEPMNTEETDISYLNSELKYFPKEKLHLVTLYASIQVLKAKMTDYTFNEEDLELTQATIATLSALTTQYAMAFGKHASQTDETPEERERR